MSGAGDSGFLSRWARRKADARRGLPQPEPAVHELAAPVPRAAETEGEGGAPEHDAKALPPPPTLADVGQLNADSDYTRFVAADVEPQVRNAAMKKLFSEPGFNVMDGLDVYIDDYGKPDPLPPSVLRRLVQSRMLGLFDDPPRDDADTPAGAADRGPTTPAALGNPGGDPASIATLAPPDEDPDLRLQPHDAAGCADGAAHRAGALQDAAGQR